ncbi:hypothetical protein [Neorhizobium sp. DT-125]
MPNTPQPGQQDDKKSGQDMNRPDDKSGVKASLMTGVKVSRIGAN